MLITGAHRRCLRPFSIRCVACVMLTKFVVCVIPILVDRSYGQESCTEIRVVSHRIVYSEHHDGYLNLLPTSLSLITEKNPLLRCVPMVLLLCLHKIQHRLRSHASETHHIPTHTVKKSKGGRGSSTTRQIIIRSVKITARAAVVGRAKSMGPEQWHKTKCPDDQAAIETYVSSMSSHQGVPAH